MKCTDNLQSNADAAPRRVGSRPSIQSVDLSGSGTNTSSVSQVKTRSASRSIRASENNGASQESSSGRLGRPVSGSVLSYAEPMARTEETSSKMAAGNSAFGNGMRSANGKTAGDQGRGVGMKQPGGSRSPGVGRQTTGNRNAGTSGASAKSIPVKREVRLKKRRLVKKASAKARTMGENYPERAYYSEREWNRMMLKEKREKQRNQRLLLILILLLVVCAGMGFLVWYTVFRSHDQTLYEPYSNTNQVYGFQSAAENSRTAEFMAQDLCVASGDIAADSVSLQASSAGLFDLNGQQVLYAKDIFAKRSPASITKLMTALVTLKYGNLDELVTCTSIIKDIEYNSSVCDVKEGDVLSLRQLLYGMMVASGNDAAMMIAEHIGGSVSGFVELMNQEAQEIGATDTHFTNPHGLTDSEHYTTVYDIYLIFQEAMKYDIFTDIISRKNYYAEYQHADGSSVAVTWESTNHYFTQEAETPDNVSVFGGKTGTTEDAGACLALLTKDAYGNPYISVILHASDKDALYQEMNNLLALVEN